MIPYIYVPDLQIGSGSPVHLGALKVWPIALHPFGLLVATGVFVGTSLATRRARRLGYDVDKLNSFVTWMLLFGFVLSHMLDEVFYHPTEILRRPWSLLMVWEGLSSFGGFIGALVGIVMWKYFDWHEYRVVGKQTLGFFKLRPRPMPILPFADLILAIFPVAWIFGRSGCSVVHDHPGARATADALLAVAYPYPGEDAPRTVFGPIEFLHGSLPRYDLGLLELMFTVVVAALVALTWRKRLTLGTYAVVVPMVYAPVRFVMDFYRITEGEAADLRYGNMTFAQWCCIVLFVFAIGLGVHIRRMRLSGVDAAASLRSPESIPAPPVASGVATP